MTFLKHRTLTGYLSGRKHKKHLCDTCIVDEQVCDKKGAYRLWSGLGEKGWKVSGCSKYNSGEEPNESCEDSLA